MIVVISILHPILFLYLQRTHLQSVINNFLLLEQGLKKSSNLIWSAKEIIFQPNISQKVPPIPLYISKIIMPFYGPAVVMNDDVIISIQLLTVEY